MSLIKFNNNFKKIPAATTTCRLLTRLQTKLDDLIDSININY